VNLSFTLNGKRTAIAARTDEMLIDILRRLGCASVRETCGIGVCGACTVVLDGELASGCLLLAPLVDGRSVVTVEALDGSDPVQLAFAEAHAFQCGYCTPGMMLASKRLLKENPRPTEEEVRIALAGNICRCGCYVKIVDAVRLAAAQEARAWTS
jgi:aerobic-type carbon monoxide dehydrogenase small subunit (CoxS/CutS family)